MCRLRWCTRCPLPEAQSHAHTHTHTVAHTHTHTRCTRAALQVVLVSLVPAALNPVAAKLAELPTWALSGGEKAVSGCAQGVRIRVSRLAIRQWRVHAETSR